MLKRISLRTLTRFVVGYMLLAFFWWAVHLWRENDLLFSKEQDLLECRFSKNDTRGVNLTELHQTIEYQQIERRWHSRRRMVLAEGVFFAGCLIFGLWIVNRSANRELSLAKQRRNFLLSITHELKSPLAALQLTMETFSRRELQREQVEKLAANGLRDAARLHNLVEDMLLAARLEANWQPLPEPLDLATLVREAITSLKIRFPYANIKPAIPENFAPVSADRSGLISIIQNLLENAVKYSPQGALVELEASRNTNGRLCLQVRDQGSGIPDAEKPLIFEKFYRLGNEETRRATGTGLGLYIVQQVVKAHGGHIQVTDNQPVGTIISIEMTA